MADLHSNQTALLKEYYTKARIARMVYSRAPLLAMLPKNTEVSGETYDVPIIYAYAQGGSAAFDQALANKGNTSSAKFQVTYANDYSLASVERKLIQATRNNDGAWLKQMKIAMDGAIQVCTDSMGIQSYGDGTGSRGVVGTSGISGSTVTLADAKDAVKFQVGMYIQFADPATPTIRDSGSKDYITAINRETGVLTLSTAIATTWSGDVPQDADLVLRAGDLSSVITGLQGYLPASATPAALFGMTRTSDVTALAGVYSDLSALSPMEALIVGQSKVCEIGGGKPDHVFVHNSFFRALARESSAQIVRDVVSVPVSNGTAAVSFNSFVVRGDEGDLRVVADRYCPNDKIFCLQLNTWELASLGQMPDIFDRDTDQQWLREASNDRYEVRVGGYGNLACHAPGHNGVFTVQTYT